MRHVMTPTISRLVAREFTTTWDFDRWLETIGLEAIGQLRKITIRCEGRYRE